MWPIGSTPILGIGEAGPARAVQLEDPNEWLVDLKQKPVEHQRRSTSSLSRMVGLWARGRSVEAKEEVKRDWIETQEGRAKATKGDWTPLHLASQNGRNV